MTPIRIICTLCITIFLFYVIHIMLTTENMDNLQYNSYYKIPLLSENKFKKFNVLQKHIKDNDPEHGIRLEAHPGILHDILLSFETNKDETPFTNNTNNTNNASKVSNRDVKEFSLTKDKVKKLEENIFPVLERKIEKMLNVSSILRELKTDKDYDEEPFVCKIKSVEKAVTKNSNMGLQCEATLHRTGKHYYYGFLLECTIQSNGDILFHKLRLHGFFPSMMLDTQFGEYLSTISETPVCNYNDKDNTLCPLTGVPSLEEYQESIKNAEEEYLHQRNFKCFGKQANTRFNKFIKKVNTREKCISKNVHGRIGIWDGPCRTNDDCPFYKANKNYENERGKCLENGKCELPLNMEHVGFTRVNKGSIYAPLCHNCPSIPNCEGIECAMCCDLQEEPDYAFDNDYNDRVQQKEELNKKGLLVQNLYL